jgi:hypothetical protein
MKLTRRQVAVSLAAVAAAPAQAAPQTQPPSQPPSQPQADDLTAAARDRLKNNAGALASVPLPISTEPAFQFKA